MMGHREKLDGDGWEAFSKGSRKIVRFGRGERAWIKRTARKRARLTIKHETRKALAG